MSSTLRLTTLLVAPLLAVYSAPVATLAQQPATAGEAAHLSTIRRAPPGPHAVGFRSVELSDPSRAFGTPFDEEGNPLDVRAERPIAASIWYPAASEGGSHLRLVDYIGFYTTAGTFPGPAEHRAETAHRLIDAEAGPPLAAHAARELDAAVHARLDAPAAESRFPLVVYAPGRGSSAVDNFYLHEWLASIGYVVVGVDSWGPFGAMSGDAAGLETQVRDMEHALGWARAQPNVDASRVAFVGFSWGGMANVMAAVRNPAVSAIVSLDGSIHFFSDRMKDFPFFAADRLTVPSLFLSAGHLAPDVRRNNGHQFFDDIRYSDATMVVFPQLMHSNFTSVWPLLDESRPGLNADTMVVGPSLERIARYTAAFLDAVLKDDADGRAFLARAPEENAAQGGVQLAATLGNSAYGVPNRPAASSRVKTTPPGR